MIEDTNEDILQVSPVDNGILTTDLLRKWFLGPSLKWNIINI
jgi:hypothetical protein